MAGEKEDEWSKTLMDSVGRAPMEFDKELQVQVKGKMAGLNPNASSAVDLKLSANARLVKWLEKEGAVCTCAGVYMFLFKTQIISYLYLTAATKASKVLPV
jgi:hypothetical protein